MELRPGMKISADMIASSGSQMNWPTVGNGSSLAPGMKIDPSMIASGGLPAESTRQVPEMLKPAIGLGENLANQVTQLGTMATLVPNALGSIGGELAASIVNQRMPTIDNISARMNEGSKMMEPLIYQPTTASGQELQGAITDTLTAIPKAVDALDSLSGDKFKVNFPNIYAATQATGELAPFMVLAKGVHAGLPEVKANGVNAKLDFPEQVASDSPEMQVPSEVKTIDVTPDVSSLAQEVAGLATSPVLSKTEQAAKAVERIDQIEAKLKELNIDPQTASPELMAEAGKLQTLKERLQKGYENVSEELGGESSPFEAKPIDTIQNPNTNLEKPNEVIKGMIDHFSNPDVGDSTVYSSPSLLSHGNFVEDLLLGSGIKNKVALLDINDIKGAELTGEMQALKTRLETTKNFGVVATVKDGEGNSRYIAVINSPEILRGKGPADAMRLTEAALHEAFGHVVVGERYSWASEETKGALEKDFIRYTKLPAEEATKAFYPLKTGEIAIGVPEFEKGTSDMAVDLIRRSIPSDIAGGILTFGKRDGGFSFLRAAKSISDQDLSRVPDRVWNNLPGLAEAIAKETNRRREKAAASDTPEYMKAGLIEKIEYAANVIRKTYLADYVYKDSIGAKISDMAISGKGGSLDTHFKEWLVNGITKWATSEAEPIGLANKWFKKVADAFKKAFAKEGAAQTPESIKSWMNSMFDSSRLEDAKPVEVAPKSVEPHGSYKKLSIGKQVEKIKKVVSNEDLKGYSLGTVEGYDNKTIGVYKIEGGKQVLLDKFSSTSRSSAQREANLFKYAHALASRGLAEPLSSSGARVKFYQDMLGKFKEEVQAIADQTGDNFNQVWLDFIGDSSNFGGFKSLKDAYRTASIAKYVDRFEKIAEHNPAALRKAILYEKRVVPAEVQELVKAEPIIKEELQETKQVSIQNSNLNFEDRIKGKALETVDRLNKVGSKVNLERITTSVLEKLKLSGKDAREAREYLKKNYEDLKAGTKVEASIGNEIEKNIESQKVPDDVSLEEALAYSDLIDDLAVRRKKSGPITGPLYEKVIKAKKAKKEYSEEQISVKIKARLEKEKEFVDKTSLLEQQAEKANVSLTEYLRAVGKDKDGNAMSEDTIAKVIRKYQRLAKTIFTDTEHIIRLGRELGLVSGDTGVQGLEAYIQSVFPKAQGPLRQLTITGRDILMKRMQDVWFQREGSKFDFRQFKSMRELQSDQIAAMNSRSGWEKFKHGITYFMNTAADELNTTPAGAQLVHLIRNKISTENALYLRDYMKRLNDLAEKVTDPLDREHILDVYEGRSKARNKVFQEGADLMHEIYSMYGKEMEALGVRVSYKGGYQAAFKFDENATHYPHMWEPGAFDKPSEKMINSLIISGEAVDPKQARAIISQFGKRQVRMSAPRFANLEMAREVQMEGYIKDPIKVTTMYLNRGASRLAILREFGQEPEQRLAQLAWDHFQQSKDPDQLNFAVKVINSITGVAVHEPLMKRALNIVGVAEFTAMASALQHAAIIQPSIISNLTVTAGWKNTVKGFARYIKADPRKASMSKEWADVLGASGRSVGKELMDELGTNSNLQSRADKLLNFWKVTTVDRWLRDASTLVGQLHVNEMVERAINQNDPKAHKELKRLGLESGKFEEALAKGDDKAVEDYVKKGAYAFSQRTNLLTDPLSKPLWQMEHTSWGGLLTLFGRFGFLQHHFLKSIIQDGSTKSDSAGRLAKYLAAATAVGVPIYTARQLAKGVNPVEDFAEKGLFGFMFGAIQSGGGLGLFADAAGQALNEMVTGTQSTANERFGGPVASLAKETLTGAGKIMHGELNNAQALRLLLRAGVVTGVAKAPEKYIPVAGAIGLARPMIERALAEKQQPNSMFK